MKTGFKTFQFIFSSASVSERLDLFVLDKLKTDLKLEISRKKIKKWIDSGLIHCRGKVQRFSSFKLNVNDQVLVKVPLSELKHDPTKLEISFELTEDLIAYEDNFIIVVEKPSGLPTQATKDPKRDHLFAATQRYLNKRAGKIVYLGLHHRLDRDTSGLVLFTKKKSANKEVSLLFSEKLIQKTYLAISRPKLGLKNSWSIKNHLGKFKAENNFLLMKSLNAGGDFAHTDFLVVDKTTEFVVIQAQPRTGRTHQIRVHLYEDGLGIVGDEFYKSTSHKRLMLHAYSLSFLHPENKKRILVKTNIPKDFLDLFPMLGSQLEV